MSTPPAKPSSSNDETRSMVSNPKLDQILDRYLDDLQNGRACSREELLSNHPEVAAELAEYLDGIEMVSGLGVGSDLAPQKLGDFEIIRPIGRGAMGVVYLANQISLKRPVAIKVLRYSVSGKQATARFEREAELVATLQHPNIVPIYATGKHDNLHFLAMQLIDGPSLSQWSAADDADRDPITLAKWGAQVARALAHAHQRDVIHRDVKPSNLLQDEDQKIWLTDFGLARRFDDLRMSMTGAMLGTPNYMSPEQASPSRYPIDHRTDIYSLGATLFELLTGRCVFLAETPHAMLAQVLAEEPPQLRELLPDASRDLETILMKCLEKGPNDRYQTADQLADDLGRVISREVRHYDGTLKRDPSRELSLQSSLDQSSILLGGMLASDTASPSVHADDREQQTIIAEVLEALPDDYRQVIILRNLQGLSHAEVAVELDRTESAVRMLWLRALKQLRAEVLSRQ